MSSPNGSEDMAQDHRSSTEPLIRPSSPASTGSDLPLARSKAKSQYPSYATAISKGHRLLDLVQTSFATPSQFTSATELKDWGYITTLETVFPHNHKDTCALLQLIIPGCVPDAEMLTSVHIIPTTHNGIVSPKTNAWLVNAIDLTNGILIAASNDGPVFTTRECSLNEGEELPQLMHWSDMAYLQALSLSHVNAINHRVPPGTVLPEIDAIKNLRYIVCSGIENKAANLVIHDIIQKHITGQCGYRTDKQGFDANCPHCCAKIPWPGITVGADTEETAALVGTPNGSGVVWLLAQHGEFKGKTVSGVTMWSDASKKPPTPNLLFYLGGSDADGEEAFGCLSGKTDNREFFEVTNGE